MDFENTSHYCRGGWLTVYEEFSRMTLIRKQLLPKPVGWLLVVMLVALYVQAWSRTRINVTDFPAFTYREDF